MKKIVILCLMVMMAIPLWGQESYSKQPHQDIVAFSGLISQPTNLNTYGYYYGFYLDYLPMQSENKHWTGGMYTMVNSYQFTNNLKRYTGKEIDVGVGETAGYYTAHFSKNSQLFIGLSLGLLYKQNRGKNVSGWGIYRSEQRDLLLTMNVNINILRTKSMFPRTQLELNSQNPIMTGLKAFWNDSISKGTVWKMTYYQLLFKQSLIDLRIGKIYYSPKVIFLASFAVGNEEESYGPGGEIAFHQANQDDFLEIYYLYKFSNINPSTFTIGINLNFSLIMKKKK